MILMYDLIVSRTVWLIVLVKLQQQQQNTYLQIVFVFYVFLLLEYKHRRLLLCFATIGLRVRLKLIFSPLFEFDQPIPNNFKATTDKLEYDNKLTKVRASIAHDSLSHRQSAAIKLHQSIRPTLTHLNQTYKKLMFRNRSLTWYYIPNI